MKQGKTISMKAIKTVVCAADDHTVNVGRAVSDQRSLSSQVRSKLRNNGQTASSLINVSSPSDDTVRLAGFVSNDGIRQEAERLAYQVEGVRFVVNTLEKKRLRKEPFLQREVD